MPNFDEFTSAEFQRNASQARPNWQQKIRGIRANDPQINLVIYKNIQDLLKNDRSKT